jgi:hypothetical protein
MNEHPESDELLAYALGDLDATRTPAITAHVATCTDCAAVIARVEMVRATVRADAALAPSARALARVTALAAGRARPRPERISGIAALKRVVASLTFDSRSSPAHAGLRGHTTAYLLRYELDTLDLDLEIEPAGGPDVESWQITGQISAPDPIGPLPLAFAAPGSLQPLRELRTDADGMFFAELPPGTYDALIQLDDHLVTVPGLEVG